MKKRKGRRLTKRIFVRKGEQSGTPADDPRATAEKAAEAYFGKKDGPEANRRLARYFLFGTPSVAGLTLIESYLEFGEIDSFDLSFTVFEVVLCLLAAAGFYFVDKPEYHTPVRARGGLLDYVGAFWLLACAFGPFFGWLVTSAAQLTEDNWRWRYVTRAVLCVAVPVLTALPLFVYVRGKGWWLMLLMLVGVTSLPAWSAVNSLLDLREGPVVKQTTSFYDAEHGSFRPAADGEPFKLTLLTHTQRSIKIEPSAARRGERLRE